MHDREAVRWLQLTYKVPSEPSQKRVWVWRRLQNLGAYALQNSVYLLPFSEEIEKHFRQLAHEIHEMNGEASIFLVVALDVDDERRILQILLDTRNNEYDMVVKACAHFFSKAAHLVETQNRNEQGRAEFAEVLEKVHGLFRIAKRHDLLGTLTAGRRAVAAEALAVCEQISRVLLDKDYPKARRLLESHSDLYRAVDEVNTSGGSSLVDDVQTQNQASDAEEQEPPL